MTPLPRCFSNAIQDVNMPAAQADGLLLKIASGVHGMAPVATVAYFRARVGAGASHGEGGRMENGPITVTLQ
jgi:hypothetical protein